jgi:peptide/nickel transport system substrate-binding protein
MNRSTKTIHQRGKLLPFKAERKKMEKSMKTRGGVRNLLKIIAGAVAAVTMLGTVSACGGSAPAAGKQVIVNLVDPNDSTAVTVNYNPYPANGHPLLGTQGGLYQALFYLNNYDTTGKGLQPQLGTSYTIAPDGKSVDVKLRTGAKWSDGKPFTADDVVFTWGLVTKTKAMNLNGLTGTASKVSDSEVKITFPTASYMDIPKFLTQTYILPQHIWSTIKDPANYTNADAVGIGPLTTKGGHFTSMAWTLMWNKNYYNQPKNHIDGARFVVYTTTTPELTDLNQGNIDWSSLTLEKGQTVASDVQQVNVPSSEVALITCSNAAWGCKGPITDPAVRQAIFYALDRTQINNNCESGQYLPINGSMYPTQQYQDDIDKSVPQTPVSMDPDDTKAESLLKDAGYTKGSDGIYQKDGQKLDFQVSVSSGTADWLSCIAVMNQQTQKVGIKLTADSISASGSGWSDLLHGGHHTNDSAPFQLAFYGLRLDPGSEAFTFYNLWFNGTLYQGKVDGKTQVTGNYARYNSPVVNKALATINSTSDAATKKAAYSTIQNQVFKDMPYIPILRQGQAVQMSTKYVSGWPTSSNLYANPGPAFSPDYAVILEQLKKK